MSQNIHIMVVSVTEMYWKEKKCHLEAAYNMVFSNSKMNMLRYNVCMAKNAKSVGGRPKYCTIPSD